MFFSDELLTGRKGSLGIIWLMATLGPRSKRVTRKALSDVDLSRSCEIIAQPPEPMALRLSGSLLVGVARVYGQKFDIFCSDVQNFDSSLRRSILTELGSEADRGGKVAAGIDLPGGGKSRLDQITFDAPLFDTTMPFDFEFAHINWSNPASSRKRRATSKLSSLQTISSIQQGDDDEEDELDDDFEVEVGRKRHRSATPLHVRVSSIRQPSSDHFDPYIDDASHNFEPVYLGILDEPSDLTASGAFDGGASFEMSDSQDMMKPADLPIDGQAMAPTQNAKQEQLEVEPQAKKARKRAPKKLSFDDDLEIICLSNNEYIQMMAKQQEEVVNKKAAQVAQVTAQSILCGGKAWMTIFDGDTQEWFNNLTAVHSFKWEQAVLDHRLGRKARQDSELPGLHHDDPADMRLHGLPSEFNDQSHGVFNASDLPDWSHFGNESEVGRLEIGGNFLPWEASSFTSFNDHPELGASPNSRRLSTMTDHERFLRGSQDGSKYGGSQLAEPLTASRLNTPSRNHPRSRSASILSIPAVNDHDFSQLDLPDLDNSAFAPALLASIETQCRSFFRFLESRMLEQHVSNITFADLLLQSDKSNSRPTTKHVAAAAFYNCLNLATKRILDLKQNTLFGTITISITAH